EPAIGLGDDDAEEALLANELPDVRRKVHAIVGDVPLMEHPAELHDRTVEERLLVGRELRLRVGEELLPVGLAGEEVRIPPDASRVERFLLRLRDLRQDLLVEAEERA